MSVIRKTMKRIANQEFRTQRIQIHIQMYVCGFDVARHCHVKNFILDVLYFLNTNRRFGSQTCFRLHMKLEEAHNL